MQYVGLKVVAEIEVLFMSHAEVSEELFESLFVVVVDVGVQSTALKLGRRAFEIISVKCTKLQVVVFWILKMHHLQSFLFQNLYRLKEIPVLWRH